MGPPRTTVEPMKPPEVRQTEVRNALTDTLNVMLPLTKAEKLRLLKTLLVMEFGHTDLQNLREGGEL